MQMVTLNAFCVDQLIREIVTLYVPRGICLKNGEYMYESFEKSHCTQMSDYDLTFDINVSDKFVKTI